MIYVLRVIMAAAVCAFVFLLINYLIRKRFSKEDDQDV